MCGRKASWPPECKVGELTTRRDVEDTGNIDNGLYLNEIIEVKAKSANIHYHCEFLLTPAYN